eukprot:COSAG01_NODE_28120_length_668_cov_2.669596_1_plen_170_part_10
MRRRNWLEMVGTLPMHPVRAARTRLPRGAEWPCRSAPGVDGGEHSGTSCMAPDRSSWHTLAAHYMWIDGSARDAARTGRCRRRCPTFTTVMRPRACAPGRPRQLAVRLTDTAQHRACFVARFQRARTTPVGARAPGRLRQLAGLPTDTTRHRARPAPTSTTTAHTTAGHS